MAKKNNGSGVDYYELRRQHQEYLEKQRRAAEAAKAAEAAEPAPVVEEPAIIENIIPAVEETPAGTVYEPAEIEPAAPVADAPAAEAIPTEEAPAAEEAVAEPAIPIADPRDEEYDDSDDEDEIADASFLSPFARLAKNAFGKVRGMISRESGEPMDGLDDSDEGYEDIDNEPQEEKHGPFRFFRKRTEEDFESIVLEDEAPAEDAPVQAEPAALDILPPEPSNIESAEDAPAEDFPAEEYKVEDAPAEDEPIEEESAPDDIPEEPSPAVEETVDDDYAFEPAPTVEAIWKESQKQSEDDEMIDVEFEDGDNGSTADGIGLGRRILNVFFDVIPEDEYEAAQASQAEYEDDDIDENDDIDVDDVEIIEEKPAFDDSLFVNAGRRNYGEKEIIIMDDQNRKTHDITELMSAGMDEKILSRRERRELRMKQEAEMAAEKAEDEAPASAPELEEPEPDDPTREYKIVSRPAVREEAVSAAGETENDEDEDMFFDEDDVEVEEAPVRRGLFGRKEKKAADEEYDDDYDDYDEEEDEAPKSRKKSRPAKKSRKYEDDYEDDEDFDDEDDYEDDYEEPRSRRKSRKYDDDYDDYGDDDYDDYDEDDDYDDYDDSPSAGHYVLGFIKVVIALVLVLVVAVFGMYFADQAIDGGFGPYRFICEKVPFINEYLPATQEADAAGDQSGDGAAIADPEATDEPVATGEPEVSAAPEATAPAEGDGAGETDTGSVG